MYVCMHECMHVCMRVCVYVCIVCIVCIVCMYVCIKSKSLYFIETYGTYIIVCHTAYLCDPSVILLRWRLHYYPASVTVVEQTDTNLKEMYF